MSDIFGDLKENSSKVQCKGLVYRYRKNEYVNAQDEIVFEEKFIPLKRRSCSGCKYCGGMVDSLKENISCGVYPVIPEGLNGGDLVTLITVVDGTDFETGYADEWHEEFVKIEESSV